MGGEFTEEKNFTRCQRKNCQEIGSRHFRMWLQYSKLILFKRYKNLEFLFIFSLCNTNVF